VRGKGRILLEAWAIPDSRFFTLWLLVSRVNSPKVWVEAYLAHLRQIFAKKWDHCFWGGVVAPEGDLVFRGKSSRPFALLTDEIYICTTNWGVGYVNNEKRLGNPF
jgi:hypothetical protein